MAAPHPNTDVFSPQNGDVAPLSPIAHHPYLLNLLVEHSPAFIAISNIQGMPIYANRFAINMVGARDFDEIRQTPIPDCFAPDERAFISGVVLPAVQEQGSWQGESRLRHFESGEPIPVIYQIFRIDDPKSGKPTHFATIAHDLRDRHKSESRDAFLVRLDDTLRPLVEPEEIAEKTAQLLAEHLRADRCAYSEVEDDQETSHVAGHYTRVLPNLPGRYRLAQFGASFARSMRANAPCVMEDAEIDPKTDGVREAYQQAGIRSAMAAPLVKAGRLVAILALHQSTPRQWQPQEVGLLQLVADRCWESRERARVSLALQISERRLRLSQRAGRIGSFEWLMPEGRVIWTPELEALYDVPEGTFEGTLNDWIKRVLAADAERVIAGVQACIAQRQPEYAYEFRAILPDGSLRWLRGQSQFLYDESGVPERMLGVNIDIHARKQAEAHIEQQWRTFDAALSNTPDFTYTFNLLGRFTYANRPLLSLLQKSLEEVVDRDFFELAYPPELAERLKRQIQQVIDTKKPVRDQTPFASPAGEIGHYEYIFVPIFTADGRVEAIAGSTRDITEQKQAEEALRRANRELEEFAYVASHDLQEPLRMVNIYTQQILRAVGPADPDLAAYGGFVRQGVQRMETLIHDLLTFSRTVHGDELPVGEADLSASLAEAISVLKNTIEETGAVISAQPLPMVRGETPQMAHVFQNLLSNALKYRQDGVPPVIHISAQREGTHWTISVQDNGLGFEQKYADRIFGLFKRLHKGEYPGTGLGLAICQRVVERFGGRIWANSAPGQGAVFHLSLPAVKAS